MKTRAWGGIAVFLFAAFAVQAQEANAPDSVRRLVERSGMAVQLDHIARQMVEQIRAARDQVPPEMLPSFIESAKVAFRGDALVKEVERAIADTMAREDIDQAIAWLETDVGRRVTREEELASATLDENTLRAFAEGLKARPMGAERARLVAGILEASFSMESAVRMLQSMALGVAMGMDSMQPPQKRAGLRALQAQLKRLMPAADIRASLQETMPLYSAYMYRNVPEADLAAYHVFLQTPVGRRYSERVADALETAMVRASVRMGELLEPPGSRRGT